MRQVPALTQRRRIPPPATIRFHLRQAQDRMQRLYVRSPGAPSLPSFGDAYVTRGHRRDLSGVNGFAASAVPQRDNGITTILSNRPSD